MMPETRPLRAIKFPDDKARRRLDALVGLDDIKQSLLTALRVATNPTEFKRWASRHKGAERAAAFVLDRPPLFILGGDVGTGKTEIAETIGDALARSERINVTLFTMSLAARGSGYVGEMTQRITAAFSEVREWHEGRKPESGGSRSAGLMFIDEADAIAQSRESTQMHHEDRAGVNALIRGVDDLSRANVAVGVLMATNRLDSLDPAIRRRAANIYLFGRPNEAQRLVLFERILPDLGLDKSLDALVAATGPNETRDYGYTYSDIVQRLIPAVLLEGFSASTDLTLGAFEDYAKRMAPTPPFVEATGR